MDWFLQNWATVLVAAVIALFVVWALVRMIQNKKEGRENGCPGACSGCAMKGSCHSSNRKDIS